MSAKKKTAVQKGEAGGIYERIVAILEQSRAAVIRSVNTTQVIAYWLIGREIIQEEQAGNSRAGYGDALMEDLAQRLRETHGKGLSLTNLKMIRQFYLAYPVLLPSSEKSHTLCDPFTGAVVGDKKGHTVCDESPDAARLNPNLSWSHYRALMRVQKPLAREFYEGECIQARWSVRELERQMASLYYERLLMSKNRKKMILVNRKPPLSYHAAAALEVIKDPYVLEFLGLPEHHTLNETDLEAKLVGQLQTFLMELGQGFAFIGRQQRLTLDGDHFYADLVFYHTKLKCHVVIDLKTKKLSHADLGQMQLYVNYYDEEVAAADDNPTLGLILCTDKNEAVCRYVLGKGNQTIFTSRYQLHLPTEEQLAAELRRELALIRGGQR